MALIYLRKRGDTSALNWLSSLIIVGAIILVAIMLYLNWGTITRYLGGSILSRIFG